MGPVVASMKSHSNDIAEEWRLSAKSKTLPLSELSAPWPQTLFSSLSCHKAKCGKHRRSLRDTKETKAWQYDRVPAHPDRNSFESSNQDTNPLSYAPQPFYSGSSRRQNGCGVTLRAYFTVKRNPADSANSKKALHSRRRLLNLSIGKTHKAL